MLFAAQAGWCSVGHCFKLGVDPDVYKAILLHDQALATSSAGIGLSLLFFILLGLLTGLVFHAMAKNRFLTRTIRPDTQGWIRAIAEGVTDPKKAVTAFVLTKTGHDGLFVAYEGVVQQLTLDDDQAITMVALAGVDRFLVQIAYENMRRLDCDSRPMLLMQILKPEIANIAFDIIDLEGLVN